MFAQERPLIDWDWIGRNLDEIGTQTFEHLALTGVAVGVGLALSVVLSLVALRWPRAFEPISSTAGLLYTIPSLAVFAFLAPIFGVGTAQGRFLTAEVALVSYTLLILIRNIVTGVKNVPSEAVEAARGMGYRPWQVVTRVQIPLALPVIIAGLRIATVTVVGLVTVTSLLGLGGLGFFILDGLRKLFSTEIIVGVVLSVALGAVLDLGLFSAGRVLTPWTRERTT